MVITVAGNSANKTFQTHHRVSIMTNPALYVRTCDGGDIAVPDDVDDHVVVVLWTTCAL